MKTTVIYHRADFDGIFCREIAKKLLPGAELIGWDYGDPVPTPEVVSAEDQVYMLDISIEGLMGLPHLIWIDHHASAIMKFPASIPGYRIDGVAACRLAWQWFTIEPSLGYGATLPGKKTFVDREVSEPLAVRLAGEYDVWDKRDGRAELFQHGLRSCDLTPEWWERLLDMDPQPPVVEVLLERGLALQYAQTRSNESVIKELGFTFQWEGLTFLGCNNARYNSHLFTAGLRPEHDGCFGFKYDGKGGWSVSLYGVPGKPDVDLAAIAGKYGGGGHKQACGFRTKTLPFLPA